MLPFARKMFFSAATACFALALGATPALATTTHHKHHAKTHHHAAHHAKGSEIIRIAQRHLTNLGYYAGTIDGVMGSQTKAAIKHFQRDQKLKADGVLGSKTSRALENADHPTSRHGQFMTHETVTTADLSVPSDKPVNQDYATSLNGGTKTVSTRFARVDVAESGSGAGKRYDVSLDGQPILVADGQPSVVGMSQTYDLGNEDAIVFTTFSPNGSGCTYRHHVLALSSEGSKLLDVENCTRDFEAVAKNGSLFITFPEQDSGDAVGSTWRLEGMSLNRL